jgi:hypothetical protein
MEAAIYIRDHIIATILGAETAHYPEYKHTNPSFYKFICANSLGHLFTHVYNSVINRKDPIVNRFYDELYEISGHHSLHCLIICIAQMSIFYSSKLVRDVVNNSQDEYSENIDRQLESLITVENIHKIINHSCNGPPVSEMKPVPEGYVLVGLELCQ